MDFNAKFKQCPRGHWYDPSKADTCPQCSEEEKNRAMGGFESYGATEPVSGAGSIGATQPAQSGFDTYGPTEPAGGFANYSPTEASGGYGETMPPPRGSCFTNYAPTEASGSFSSVPDYDKFPSSGSERGVQDYGDNGAFVPSVTMPPSGSGFPSGGRTAFQVENYGQTEPVFSNQTHGFLPVVGWLVCVDGPDRGRDYRIHDGYNSIGRSANMDICIAGDTKISREKHAVVAFDPDEKMFFFAPADGKNLVKLNGKTLMMAAELHAYDTLTIGSSKLKFVPFCGEEFSWTDEN